MTRIRSLAFWALVGCLGSWLTVELALRVADYDVHPSAAFRYHPDLGWTQQPGDTRLPGVNELGFRFRDEWSGVEGVRRVVVLGDSLAIGRSYSYEVTFPGLLERWLNKAGPDRWQVINLSAGGWGNAQQLIALREIGLAYEPDLVVWQLYPYNDLCNNTRVLRDTCSTQDMYRPYFEVDGDGLKRDPWTRWRFDARRVSRLFGAVEARMVLSARRKAGYVDGSNYMKRFFRDNAERKGLPDTGARLSLAPEAIQPTVVKHGWEVTDRIVAETAELLAAEGVPLVAVVIPHSYTFPGRWRGFTKIAMPGLQSDYASSRLEEILQKHDVPTILIRARMLGGDMEPMDHFEGFPYALSHLNRFGHYKLARWIVDVLDGRGLFDPRRIPVEAGFDVLNPTDTGFGERGFGEPGKGGSRVCFAPLCRVVFESGRPRRATLDFELQSLRDDQLVMVRVNTEPQITLGPMRLGARQTRSIPMLARKGRNKLEFSFDTGEKDFPPTAGPGVAAVRFLALEVR